jgi:hypothetical protein
MVKQLVISAEAGIQAFSWSWIPVLTEMTEKVAHRDLISKG